MKKITIISVLLATAVIANVTAQRRTSSQEERGATRSTKERSYSDKSERSNSNKTYSRSSSASRSTSPDTRRKEVTTPSRKPEMNRSGSEVSRANSRTSATNRNSERSNNRSEVTVPSRNVEPNRSASRETRPGNRTVKPTARPASRPDNLANVSRERSVNPPRNVNAGNRGQGYSSTRENRTYGNQRNEVNANRNVRHYPTHRKYVRKNTNVHVHVHKPRPIEYRARYYPYRRPVHVNIVWTPRVYRDYCVIYPELRSWRYHRGYVVHTISAYDAYYHLGEVRRVYGKVSDTFYAYDTDEYFLYIGARFPYQDFTVVVPGYIARSYHRNPERYFYRNHIEVTGLITSFDGEPEMVVKRHSQIDVY